jgi:hypothetical protein
MKQIRLASLVALLLLTPGVSTSVLWAGAAGTFLGEIVSPPRGETSAGLVYLMGRDGYVRRVIVARAAVVYDTSVPSGDRTQSPRKALVPGAEVRVTALVDAKSGEWTASRVEVIAHRTSDSEDDNDDSTAPDEVTSPSETTAVSRTI